jgi:hypothetical protein
MDAPGKDVSVHEPVERQLESVLSDVVSPAELSKAKREVLRVFEQHDSYQGANSSTCALSAI